MKILSCVPQQLNNFSDKLKYLENLCEKFSPDILVTPQEYIGGAFVQLNKLSYSKDELLPILQKISIKYDVALIIGVVEFIDTQTNKEAVWFIDKGGLYRGVVYKFALPKYDHILTNGYGHITPEVDFENRFKLFEICSMNVSAIFCWEVYSDILWSGLSLCKPDIIFSLIKFGVNAWPVVKVNPHNKEKEVVDFGYGGWNEDGCWIERLFMANKWQVRCPIICSTNSWGLRPISMPLCGCISLIDGQAQHSLWHPKKEDQLKQIPEKIVLDHIDVNKIRLSLENKFQYKEVVGEFPPYSLGKYTMMLKINRLQTRLLSGSEKQKVENKKIKKGLLL